MTTGIWPSNLFVHNNPDLIGQDGCKDYTPVAEDENSILLIRPEDVEGDWRPIFFLAGCSEGEGDLRIISGDDVTSFPVNISAP